MSGFELVKHEAAKNSLAECVSVDEVKIVRDKAVALQAYAKQANDFDLEKNASQIRIRAERRCGELLSDMDLAKGNAGKGRPSLGGNDREPPKKEEEPAPPTLADMGLTKKQSSSFQKLAAIDGDIFEDAIDELDVSVSTNSVIKAATNSNHRAQGTGENEWYTPDNYIEAAREVMGSIDLDPASSLIANKTVKAKKYFTKDDDGIGKKWTGNVWLNPPYSQPAIAQFSDAVVSNSANVDAMIVLTHNYTDTKWFHTICTVATAICFTRGRIGFVSPTGERAAPTQGQCFFYVGDDVASFDSVFNAYGLVVQL